ncbi:hypothetical protein FHG87_020805 [Trinorchestia longiramus]|nr:hypothetical protein FHG87_020805 [Trinorchestia longiramus]
MDSSVFRQVQSPDSIVQNLPDNSPRLRSLRMLSAGRSSNHQSPVFIPASSVSLGEDFRVQGLPSEARRISRRQQTTIPTRTAPQQRAEAQDGPSAKDILAKTMAKVWFERNADKAQATLRKTQLTTRMKELRKQLDYIDDTEWYYTPVDELIGQY